ncbi:hypothetical protein NC653_037063 [Populus alba x Populus x berolinensis]|uniref:anthocyanidin 3-O-glucosyltransferase n=1 Tax=Populus alba x Populus x berolinensis TaxID=444605 RepID=A0AAD6LLM7_9ROSI|nr:hypothetical protein NC653_037063 [Populus alba x Populus x berolinensis]
MKPGSVIYACLGSLCRLVPSQLIELGLGLGRGLLIKGWAPQVLILSHRAIGGFLTHCGWNSTVEGICAGVPMITWPQFSEQFLNEKLIVEILRIGVRVGVEVPVSWGEEEKVWSVGEEDEVKKTVITLMDTGGEEGKKRRTRAIELGKTANKAMELGGSSNLNLSFLIQDITKQQTQNKVKYGWRLDLKLSIAFFIYKYYAWIFLSWDADDCDYNYNIYMFVVRLRARR